MKKKTVLAMLIMCMAFGAAACGNDKESGKTQTEEPAAGETEASSTENEKTDSGEKEEAEKVRLVSVSDVSDYVTIGNYKGLELDNIVQPVSDEDVEAEIEYRLQDSSTEVTDGTVEQGDLATVNYTGTIDGQEFEGGSAEDYEFTVGDSGMAADFDNGVIGMKKGDTKEVTVNFPADYYDTSVAGKTAVYEITLQKFTRTPELTDQWVAENSDVKTVDEYRQSVKADLEENASELARMDLYASAWTMVLDASEVKEYPQEDIDKASQAYKDLNEQYIQEAGMDMNEFLESQGISEEEYEEECSRYAQAKVEQNLIVQGIMDQENLSLEDQETQELQGQLIQEYGVTDINQLVEIYGQQEVNESLALLRVEKFIVDNATVDEKVGSGSGDDAAQNEDVVTGDAAYDTGIDGDTSGDYVDADGGDMAEEEADDVVVIEE